MHTKQEIESMNVADGYTLLYSFIVDSVIQKSGLEGEKAMREGIRNFGRDRGLTRRKVHLDVGAKINMLNLFSLYSDLPSDPRFRREKQFLNPQERVSHTLVCPMADIWESYGHREIGRMYCEEFHNACYSAYAFDYTQVNLARTLTQEGDTYCAFNVILRPENLPPELRPVCFEEYDPNYTQPNLPDKPVSAKEGFNILSIKIYYHLLAAATEGLGRVGVESVGDGLEKVAKAIAAKLKEHARVTQTTIDRNFVEMNFPLRVSIDEESIWLDYGGYNAKQLIKDRFYTVFHNEMGLTQR